MEVEGDATSSSLLQKVREFDQRSWDRLIRLYGPLVYRWCRQSNLQDSDAADIGQEVFRSVARSLGQFLHDSDQGTFRGWLKTITVNKIRDFARTRQKSPQGVGGQSPGAGSLPDIAFPEPDDSAFALTATDDQLLRRRAIEMTLEDCDDRTRQVFWRLVAEDQPPRQVAADFGMTVNAVYVLKSRLLRRIRVEFKDLVDFQRDNRPGEGTADWKT